MNSSLQSVGDKQPLHIMPLVASSGHVVYNTNASIEEHTVEVS